MEWSAWSVASAFAAGGGDNDNPTVVYDAVGEGHLVWQRGADLVHATLSNSSQMIVRAGSTSAAFNSAKLLTNSQGNLTLVWQESSDEGTANIYAMLYDTATNTWSADRRLNEDEGWLSHDASGYYGSDDALHLAYLATAVHRTSESVVIGGQFENINHVPEEGQTDLRVLDHTLGTDLAVTDNDLSTIPTNPQAGDSTTASLDVHNAGDFPVSNYVVNLYVGGPNVGGIQVGTMAVSNILRAGDHQVVSFPAFAMPASGANLVAVVEASGSTTEITKSNNQATAYILNVPPQANATASVTSGTAPLTVNFNAGASTDAEGDPLSFSWAFADGSPSLNGFQVSHTFYQAGNYPVTVSVTDSHGGVGTTDVLINVAAPASRRSASAAAIIR